MPKDPLQPERCAQLLAALAAPERLKIVRFLAGGAQTVTAIADMLGIPAVNVTHHLTVLRTAGLISRTKRGRFGYYSLCPGVLDTVAGAETEAINLGCCKLELPDAVRPATSSGCRSTRRPTT
ncbi:MAG: winged helix-turn-helix domain-containing protein [Gemmataceae bacterium]